MGSGDDADIGADRLAPTDAGELALLQNPQQPGLRLGRHVADFVEEQGAAGGLLEAAGIAVGGAGEGAALVAEQLCLDQFARDRGHVDGNERTGAATAEIMQGARHQFLPGATFAVDHHREVRRRQPRDRAVYILHRRRAANERHALIAFAAWFVRHWDRGGRQRAVHHR